MSTIYVTCTKCEDHSFEPRCDVCHSANTTSAQMDKLRENSALLSDELRRLREENERMREALEMLLEPSTDATAWYEREAEMFYRETGYMAPGKSRPLAMGAQDELAASERWHEFRKYRNGETLRLARAALGAKV